MEFVEKRYAGTTHDNGFARQLWAYVIEDQGTQYFLISTADYDKNNVPADFIKKVAEYGEKWTAFGSLQ